MLQMLKCLSFVHISLHKFSNCMNFFEKNLVQDWTESNLLLASRHNFQDFEYEMIYKVIFLFKMNVNINKWINWHHLSIIHIYLLLYYPALLILPMVINFLSQIYQTSNYFNFTALIKLQILVTNKLLALHFMGMRYFKESIY